MDDRERVENWLTGLNEQKDVPGTARVDGPLSMMRLIGTEIERLQAIVATLPKIGRLDGDRIVRDVVASLGMTAYRIYGRPFSLPTVAKEGIRTMFLSSTGQRYDINGASVNDWFNTRAAAEFAIKKARKS